MAGINGSLGGSRASVNSVEESQGCCGGLGHSLSSCWRRIRSCGNTGSTPETMSLASQAGAAPAPPLAPSEPSTSGMGLTRGSSFLIKARQALKKPQPQPDDNPSDVDEPLLKARQGLKKSTEQGQPTTSAGTPLPPPKPPTPENPVLLGAPVFYDPFLRRSYVYNPDTGDLTWVYPNGNALPDFVQGNIHKQLMRLRADGHDHLGEIKKTLTQSGVNTDKGVKMKNTH